MKLNPIGPNCNEVVINPRVMVLFSYSTPVACRIENQLGIRFCKTNKKWSKTTSSHINKWLDGREAEEKEQEFFDNLVK